MLDRGGRGLEPGVADQGRQPDAHGSAAVVGRPDPDAPEGDRADEALVQQLTGEDQVQALKASQGRLDAAMIIDTINLLHSGRFDGFCIVSSDSDFTRLAQRVRESGFRNRTSRWASRGLAVVADEQRGTAYGLDQVLSAHAGRLGRCIARTSDGGCRTYAV